MAFNSYIFIFVFFPLVLIGYYGLNYLKLNKLAMCYILGMSLCFYAYKNINYMFMLVGSILINYILSAGLHRIKEKNIRLILLWAGVLINIGILFYFKYYDFFIENMNVLFKQNYSFLDIALPLGISFYTFQQLSFIIDCYRDECEEYSLLEYATYVAFFPKIIEGPIVYHSELIPQFRDEAKKKLNYENLSKGIYAFALGLAKKVLIADTFSEAVNIGFGRTYEINSPTALVVMICYSLQLYYDFSGYCDMAYGIGYMFNIELPVNFNSPYKAVSIGDFWDRWHMTLTRFFTKYVYIPLGGNRKGKVRTYVNIMIVFLVSGLWHGAGWNFIIWGAINGVGIVLDKVIGKYFRKMPKVICVAVTFVFSTFAWSIFRARSFLHAVEMWQKLFTGGFGQINYRITDVFNKKVEAVICYRLGMSRIVDIYPGIILIVFMVVVMLATFVMRNTQEKVTTMKYSAMRIVGIVLMILWSVLSLSNVSEFLYANF